MSSADSPLAACRRCGCPLAGNESYCSHCGRRVDASRRGRLVRGLAIAAVLVLLAAAGTCVARHARGADPGRSSLASDPSEIETSNRIETFSNERKSA